mgnify:CR=1 FL=1
MNVDEFTVSVNFGEANFLQLDTDSNAIKTQEPTNLENVGVYPIEIVVIGEAERTKLVRKYDSVIFV